MMSLSDLSLLVLADLEHYWDGKNYYTISNWSKNIIAFGPYFKKIFYTVPVRAKNDGDIGILLERENVAFISLPFYDSMASFVCILPKKFFEIIKIVKKSVSNSDIIFLRLPSLGAFLYFFYAMQFKKPIVCNIAGNILKAPAPIIKGFLIKRILMRFISYIIHISIQLIVKHSLVTFTMGNELFYLYKKKNNRVFSTFGSMIKKDIIFEDRNDTCQHRQIKILTIGDVIPTKGIEYLIESIYLLNKEEYDVKLDIVGKTNNQSYVTGLKRFITGCKTESRIIFHGYIPFGEKLFQLYRNADIFVVSSVSEGFPRVIIESYAFGLPLVATRIGGIPNIVINEENGLLIAPKSVREIYRAIKRIIDNEDLRKKLIRKGIEFAKNHTQEKQILSMIKIIEKQLYYHFNQRRQRK